MVTFCDNLLKQLKETIGTTQVPGHSLLGSEGAAVLVMCGFRTVGLGFGLL